MKTLRRYAYPALLIVVTALIAAALVMLVRCRDAPFDAGFWC